MTEFVIVFGGSGFIGTHLVRRLAINEQTKVISVDILPPRERIAGVEYRIADVRSLLEFEVPASTKTIYNFAAVHSTPGHDPWEYYDTNVAGAIEVTRLATRCGINEIIFTSSISVYGPSEETKYEETAPAPTSDYGRSKLLAENVHSNWADLDSDRKLVIVRPAVVFGAGECGNFTRMAKLLQKGFFIFPGRRDTIKACIYVEDLLDAIDFAHHLPEKRVLFNGSFPQRYTIEQIIHTFKSSHFPRAMTLDLPRPLVSFLAILLRAVGGARFGFHPDRVTKLVKSTDVIPGWLSARGWSFHDALPRALERWRSESNGRFD